MERGTVMLWNDEKGYGFVRPDFGGRDVYMHRTALTNAVTTAKGERVWFEVEHGPRGLRVCNAERE